MRVKRAFILICAGAFLAYALLCFVYIIDDIIYNGRGSIDYFAYLFTAWFSTLLSMICAISALAVVDFLFCYAQKKFNNSMFAIAVALLVLVAFRLPYALFPDDMFATLLAYNTSSLHDNYINRLIISFTAEMAFVSAFIGLAVAYVVVKWKYLKAQTQVVYKADT